jgi:hypothetical protein
MSPPRRMNNFGAHISDPAHEGIDCNRNEMAGRCSAWLLGIVIFVLLPINLRQSCQFSDVI